MSATTMLGHAAIGPAAISPDTSGHLRYETLTPFLAWSPDARASLDDELAAGASAPSLVIDVLRDPRALVRRLLRVDSLQGVVLGSVAFIAAGVALFAAAVITGWGVGHPARAAALAVANCLLAVAAAAAPIHVMGILLAARLPIGRLIATLLASAANGALTLGALAPLEYIVWSVDPSVVGPRALFWAFVLAGVASGARLRRMLICMAEEIAGPAADRASRLSLDDCRRIGTFVRLATLMLAFTSALSLWAFDAFLQ